VVIDENLHRNFIDHAEYPQTFAIQQRCIRMLAELFHAAGRDHGDEHPRAPPRRSCSGPVAEVEVARAPRGRRQVNGQAEPRLRR